MKSQRKIRWKSNKKKKASKKKKKKIPKEKETKNTKKKKKISKKLKKDKPEPEQEDTKDRQQQQQQPEQSQLYRQPSTKQEYIEQKQKQRDDDDLFPFSSSPFFSVSTSPLLQQWLNEDETHGVMEDRYDFDTEMNLALEEMFSLTNPSTSVFDHSLFQERLRNQSRLNPFGHFFQF